MEKFQGMGSFQISRAIWERASIFSSAAVDVPMLTRLSQSDGLTGGMTSKTFRPLLYRQVREPHRQGLFQFSIQLDPMKQWLELVLRNLR